MAEKPIDIKAQGKEAVQTHGRRETLDVNGETEKQPWESVDTVDEVANVAQSTSASSWK